MDQDKAADIVGGKPKAGGKYAYYVLLVLVIVYVFNFIDRQILSQDIQVDLGATDAEMGSATLSCTARC